MWFDKFIQHERYLFFWILLGLLLLVAFVLGYFFCRLIAKIRPERFLKKNEKETIEALRQQYKAKQASLVSSITTQGRLEQRLREVLAIVRTAKVDLSVVDTGDTDGNP